MDIAVLFTRHNGRLQSPPAVLWMHVQTSRAGIDPHGSREQQLCVPTVNIRGNSYRLKDKLKAGLVRAEEPAAVN